LVEIVATLAVTVYLILNVERLVIQIGFARPNMTDTIFGYVMTFVVINASRKAIGWAFTWMALAFIAYSILGPWAPGLLAHRGYTPNEVAALLLVNPLGIYGAITGTSANIIAIYIIFGAIMLRTGAAKAFLNLALMLAGRLTGGAGQVAVVASAMMGMVNGSAVANAATVGAFTIPMMVKRGYPRPFAGGVESAASSGGQITPPVMGVGAFIMAEILGIPYLKIAQMAAIPAVLYYVGVGLVIYFEAKKRNLGRLSGSDIPRWRTYWKELLLLLVPVIVLVYLIVMMFSPRYAGFWAVAINIVMFLAFTIPIGTGFSLGKAAESIKNSGSHIVAGMVEGGGTVATIGVLVAGAQIMVGTLGITGLPLKLSQLITRSGVASLFPLLVAAMLIACILGGPLPTVPSYLITAAVVVPLFSKFGLAPVLIHLFIFYFACFSGLTPPVFGPVYATAAFAEAGLWETAWESVKCAFIGFLVPFVFVYNPEMLGMEGLGRAVEVLLISSAGTLLVASAIVGYWNRLLAWYERLIVAAAGVMFIVPETETRIAGATIGLIMITMFWLRRRRARKTLGGNDSGR
ncbi:MAG TPA: TRAP transporter fused permease subunit, partial [Candidatus Methylomirabilis sp.]|nr:TRAP transporter fused permease subunit [Candidatus Methylomirabilis sp.]